MIAVHVKFTYSPEGKSWQELLDDRESEKDWQQIKAGGYFIKRRRGSVMCVWSQMKCAGRDGEGVEFVTLCRMCVVFALSLVVQTSFCSSRLLLLLFLLLLLRQGLRHWFLHTLTVFAYRLPCVKMSTSTEEQNMDEEIPEIELIIKVSTWTMSL